MKKSSLIKLLPVVIGVFLFLSIGAKAASAATCNWTNGGGNNLWSNTANWSCAAVPGSADTAVFDSVNSDANVTIDATVNVAGFTMQNSYSGTISQGANTITVGATGWTQSTGTFTGGTAAITFNGPFALSGGTFTSTSNTLTAKNTWTVSGGTFAHNNGTVGFNLNNNNYVITGSITFYNLNLGNGNCEAPNTEAIASGTVLTTSGTLTLSQYCYVSKLNGPGTIVADGNISVFGFGVTGSSVITISGTGAQTLSGDGVGGNQNNVPGITIAKGSGTLTISNTIQITTGSNWTYTSGTLNTTGSTVVFNYSTSSSVISGSQTFNNVTFSGCSNPAYWTVSSGTVLTVNGTLALGISNTCNGSLNGPGTITVLGNLNTYNAGDSGNIAITLNGTSAQTITASGTNFPTGTFTINKPSGTVTLAAALNLSGTSQALVFSSGTLSTGAYNLTVNGVMTIGGTLSQTTGAINAGTYITTSGGVWNNQSTGDMVVGSGGVTNYGNMNFGSAQTCGGADNIAITSSAGGTARTWVGSGLYNFYDTAITDQNETPDRGRVVAWSSTNNGNTNFNVLSTCPSPASFYWKLDEGQGTTAHDSSSNGPNGTANADSGTLGGTTLPTWQTEDQCVAGKCLYFDGTTSKVTGSKIVNNIQSVAIWVKPISVTSGTLIDLDGGTHKITVTSGTISATGFTSPTIYVNGVASSTLVANNWQLVEVTTATAFNSTASFTLATDGTTYMNGFFDEIKFYSYARTAGQVQSDFTGAQDSIGGNVLGSATTNALNQGLVGYWKMDESSWNGTTGEVKDSSGNGNNGTATGFTGTSSGSNTSTTLNDASKSWNTNVYANSTVTITGGTGSGQTKTISSNTATALTVSTAWTTTPDATSTYRVTPSTVVGKYGNGGNFDGVDQYVSIPNSLSINNFTNGITVSGWFKDTNANYNHTEAMIVEKDGNQSNEPYDCFISWNSFSCGFYNAWTFYSVSYSMVNEPINTWEQFSFTFNPNNSSLSLYLNGQLKSGPNIVNGTPQGSSTVMYIGNTFGGGTPWKGSIDDIRINNRALSPEEVSQLYNFAPGPKVYLQMDENSGTSASDSSGNSNNGTVNSGTWTQGKYGAGVKLNGSTGSNVSVPDFNY